MFLFGSRQTKIIHQKKIIPMDIQQIIASGNANITLQLTADQLAEFARTVATETIKQTTKEQREKLIPRKELLKKVSDFTLYNWKKKGFLEPVYVGGKSFYKQSDLDAINFSLDD